MMRSELDDKSRSIPAADDAAKRRAHCGALDRAIGADQRTIAFIRDRVRTALMLPRHRAEKADVQFFAAMKTAYPIVEVSSGKGAICGAILAALPDWFGIESSNAAYMRDVERMAMFAAFDGKEPIGFLALNQHSPEVFENHVLGVRPQFHRQGLGRALMTRAEDYARDRAARLLTVKTLAPSHPDPCYALTRRFYQAMGFFPVEEFPTLWNLENPCLFMAKILD